MPKPKLSPDLQAKYTAEYLDTLDRIDALKEELREEVKERKGEIATLDKAAFRLRRLLAGKELDQTEIPGAEIPHAKPRRTSMTVAVGGRSTTVEADSSEELTEAIERAGKAIGRGGRRG